MSRTSQFLCGVILLLGVLDDSSRILSRASVKADFDRNGRLDLAVADSKEAAVSIFLSAPDGRLAFKDRYSLHCAPQAILASDLNGNGAPDLATANAPDGTVSVLLNRGDGTFQSPRIYQTNLLAPFRIAANDANADGNVDLIVSDIRDNQFVLLGNGDGTFQGAD